MLEFAPQSYREAFNAFVNIATFGISLEVADAELSVMLSKLDQNNPNWFEDRMSIIRRIQALCDQTPTLFPAQFLKAYAIMRAGRVAYRAEACAAIEAVLPTLLEMKAGDESDVELKRYLPGFDWTNDFFREAAELYQGNNEPDKALSCADKYVERLWEGPYKLGVSACAFYTELVCRPKVNRPDKAVALWQKRDADTRPEHPPNASKADVEIDADIRRRFYMTPADAEALLAKRKRRQHDP